VEIDNLEKIKRERERVIDGIPGKYKGAYIKALNARLNHAAIKAKCYECICFENVKENITDCRGWTCPLYFFRPYQYPDTQEVKNILCPIGDAFQDENLNENMEPLPQPTKEV
jgi:hypothetical protein